jgi:hypothetical protein
MSNRDDENLKDLLGKFLEDKQAREAMDDINKGEQLLRENPAPEPDEGLIDDIKSQISRALLRQERGGYKRIIYKAAVVAAAVIIVVTVGVKVIDKGGIQEEVRLSAAPESVPESVWENGDSELEILAAEVEQIEDEMLAWQVGEYGGVRTNGVTELEFEIEEIDSDFWKG